MLISTIPIEHKIRHNEAIFTIHKHGDRIITGGLNGEMKIWNGDAVYMTTIKKHSGSIASVRFSLDGKFAASAGDDGYVHIFNTADYGHVHSIKHTSDVTNIEWTGDLLLSVDLDGIMIATRREDWSEARRFNNHMGSITGLCVSPDGRWVCTYSEGTLVMYKDLALVKSLEIEKGLIMESLNSRLSFAPNGKFVSVGLQFNQKSSSVDIFNNKLERIFSLIGHVAPSEITSFCPLPFRVVSSRRSKKSARNTQEKYYILAVASQDLSISFWSTSNPKPFLLIKNFSEAPVLDLCWDGTVLYASSYDGVVKRIVFESNELGEPIQENDEEDELQLPFSTKNIELAESHARRGDKIDVENYKPLTVPVGCFRINSQKLQTIIENNNELDVLGKCETDVGKRRPGENNAKPALDEDKKIAPENSALPQYLPNIDPNAAPVPVDGLRPKRIKPVMLQRAAPPMIASTENASGVVLFDANLPDKLRLAKTEMFKCQLGIYSIELNDSSTKVSVSRDAKSFYSITGIINKVAYNDKYLVLYTTHVQIYELSTGRLLLPYIVYRLAFLSILNDHLLLVSSYGDFTIIDIVDSKARTGKLPKTKGLSAVILHKKFYIVARYGDEVVYYHRKLASWLALNPEFNSIHTNAADYYNDTDETLSFIECQYRNYILLSDQDGIQTVAKQLVGMAKRLGHLSDALEYKLEEVLAQCKDRGLVKMLLEEMNGESFLWRFVEKECEKYGL